MAIPSVNDFKSYISQLETCHAGEIANQIFVERPRDNGKLEKLICTGLSVIESKLNSIDSDVEKWLQNQPSFKMAEMRAFRLKQKKHHEDVTDWIKGIANNVSGFIEEYEKIPVYRLDPADTRLYKYLNKVLGISVVAKWRMAVSQALMDYHFTDTARDISKCYQTLPSVLDDAQRSMKRLQAIIQTEFSRFNHIVDFSVVELNLKRTLQAIERELPAEVENLYPVKRADKTAKERLFVYWMERTHSSLFRTARPDAISLLLDLEGIQSPLDIRQVEKLCASFKQARRDRWRLTKHFSKTSAA